MLARRRIAYLRPRVLENQFHAIIHRPRYHMADIRYMLRSCGAIKIVCRDYLEFK